MYAIVFDLDTNCLTDCYEGTTYHGAYNQIKQYMIENGFTWTQGSVYFGDPKKINAVNCVVIAQQMANKFPWFRTCVKDIRMLRIEENNDLMPAIQF